MERPMSADALRERYLQFFVNNDHQRLPGASLIPAGDPTLLLTSAGMVPFKPYFLGLETPKHRRVTTCQPCVRTGDIDNVGLTGRHHTFFEMLGNFSFGDYFKEDAIRMAWEFVTKELGLEKDKLWVTIFHDDDEAHHLWTQLIGVDDERVIRLGKEDNFWEIGVGPCGPCSEIYYDRGESYGCGSPDCAPACDNCERYLEIWNLVFIQFHQDHEGKLTPLKNPGVDTGMGLERTASVLQGVDSNFEIDTIRPILDYICNIGGVTYGKQDDVDVSLRVIADHMRGVTFMISDGILPGNEGRGYVLRRLVRRAVRHAKLLGIENTFLPSVVDRVIDQLKTGYPELDNRRETIKEVVSSEESRFHETLDQGMDMLDSLVRRLESEGNRVLSGEDAFQLYDTYGFPLELTQEIVAGRGITLDEEGFRQAMEAQRERARAARRSTGYLGDVEAVYTDVDLAATKFVGYDTLECDARILALFIDQEAVAHAQTGQIVDVFLDQTPFYPEGGGQIADRGTITGAEGKIEIEDVTKAGDGLIVHRGRVVEGIVHGDEPVRAVVDASAREKTQRNHTATHLMHKALHDVVGDHAQQAGSLVAPDRLRFDFTHFKALSAAELEEVERRVNEKIRENLPVTAEVMPFDEAKKIGAMALFGEKYGDEVRVVKIGEYSKELCGGTHVNSSGELGIFKIVYEGSVAANVRRIEAVTAEGAFDYFTSRERLLQEAAAKLQIGVPELPAQLDKMLTSMREHEREINRLKARLARAQVGTLAAQAEDVGGIKILTQAVDGLDMDGLRALGDRLKEELGNVALVLGSAEGNKVFLIAMATDDAVNQGINVRECVQKVAPMVGGGGGGSERMAQAGGKDPAALNSALEAARDILRDQLS